MFAFKISRILNNFESKITFVYQNTLIISNTYQNLVEQTGIILFGYSFNWCCDIS